MLEEMLEEINIVPNPTTLTASTRPTTSTTESRLSTCPRYAPYASTTSGTLIRTYDKADPLTYIDWDLKNEANVPIAGGVYIIHIDVPGVGQAVRKWFGVMRPIDLDNF